MDKAIGTLIAAVAALVLSGGAYAQNNTLATPTTKSPAAATPANNANGGYGMPGATSSGSGMGAGSPDMGLQNSTNNNAAPGTTAYGTNNTLAVPTTKSPAAAGQ